MSNEEEVEAEVIPSNPVGNALATISRAEIDVQVATAHQYPRSMAVFKQRALGMVSLDEETAASCIYSRPVGKKGGVEQFAEGMSIRMAEIVGACYGNLRVGSMLIEQTERYVKARGIAHDLESNFLSTSEVIESTVDKYGKPYSERMRMVVAKAALAKARRDATFAVVPKALCKPVEEEARRIAIGDATTLAKRRASVMAWVAKLSIETARVFAVLSIKGEDDIGIEQLTVLTGLKTAIKDGEITVDEAFPPIGDAKPKLTAKEAAAKAAGRSQKPAGAATPQDNGPEASAKPAASGEPLTKEERERQEFIKEFGEN